MNVCALCGEPVTRLAMQLELSFYRSTSEVESEVALLGAHHRCATRRYVDLLERKMDRAGALPSAGSGGEIRCDLCKAIMERRSGIGMLVQLFALAGSELRLAAEFGLLGHAPCVREAFERAALREDAAPGDGARIASA